MALNFVTSFNPLGVAFYIEDATPGAPTDITPPIGSFAIVAVSGSVRVFLKTTASVWTEIPLLTVLTTGVLGTPQLLPVTLAGGNGTTTVTLPARSGGWRVIDFWISNSSGGAGAGTVQVQRGSDNAVITDALIPGAANAVTRNASLTTANNLIAGGGDLNFVRAGGWTAGVGYVLIQPA